MSAHLLLFHPISRKVARASRAKRSIGVDVVFANVVVVDEGVCKSGRNQLYVMSMTVLVGLKLWTVH